MVIKGKFYLLQKNKKKSYFLTEKTEKAFSKESTKDGIMANKSFVGTVKPF